MHSAVRRWESGMGVQTEHSAWGGDEGLDVSHRPSRYCATGCSARRLWCHGRQSWLFAPCGLSLRYQAVGSAGRRRWGRPAGRSTLMARLRGERRARAKRRHRSPGGGRSARLDLREQLDIGRRYWFGTRGQARLNRAIQPCLVGLRRFPHLEYAIAGVCRAALVPPESGCRFHLVKEALLTSDIREPRACSRKLADHDDGHIPSLVVSRNRNSVPSG
jgi:hypothetical protein